MVFYQLDGTVLEENNVADNRISMGGGHSFVCSCDDRKISLCIAMERAEESELQKLQLELCQKYSLYADSLRCRELTIDEAHHLLERGEKNGKILSADSVFSEFKLEDFNTYPAQGLSENMIKAPLTLEEANKACEKLMCSGSLRAEIARIFATCNADVPHIHPVHYAILAESKEIRKEMKDILLGSLLSAGRLGNSRYFTLTAERGGMRYHRSKQIFDMETAQAMYAGEKGGTVIVQPALGSAPFSEKCGQDGMPVDEICRLIRQNHRNVLTVLEGDSSDEQIIRKITENLPGMTFVWLQEDMLEREAQFKYLCDRAESDCLPEDGLSDLLTESERVLCFSELDRRYDLWLNQALRTSAYPQYANIVEKSEERSRPVGADYQALQRMVGLSSVKNVLEQVLSYRKMQKYAQRLDMPTENNSMHMVFSGNPGTAKTTVARLFAGILKDNGILSGGELIEVGRSEIVDRYVGGTAPRVKELFRRAMGNVLFIDEAYSLADDRSGSFGDEAINTIVQEMENARDDTVVIFAGYPREMEQFLRRNPGLNSRIAFHIQFDNYTPGELLEIARLIAESKGRCIASDAEDTILKQFRTAASAEDFGNGRFVRNCIEQACMRQARRLMCPGKNPSRRELEVLTAEDFVFEQESARKEPVRRIGFAV